MQPITLKKNGIEKTYDAPESFHELTQDQYLGAVAIMNATELRPELQWTLIPLLMKIPLDEVKELNEIQRVELLMQLDFLFDPDALPSKAMIKSFSTAEYKSVLVNRKTARAFSTILYGPGDGIKYLKFGEFRAAEQRLEKHKANPSLPNLLNEFCGCLFRKTSSMQQYDEDRRIPFREGMVEYNGQIFSKVSSDVKSAIVLNYQGSKSLFPRLYKNLFPASSEDDIVDGSKKKVNQSMMWLNTLVNMADRDVTKLDKIDQAPLHTVFKVLDDTIVHNQKMQDEMERIRNKK